ncbi:MAG: hypothetical protein H6983_00415 [Ectothiorhodospiraceae bacterium]|nr:hypothetical protein [Ectothiorhodospiraceae bacterium]
MRARVSPRLSTAAGLASLATDAAALSPTNANVRLLEDTMWVFVFVMLLALAVGMRRLSAGTMRTSYVMLAVAGCCGLGWKGLGVVKRVFGLTSPAWLLDVAREACEALAGVMLTVGFVMLAHALVTRFRDLQRTGSQYTSS